MIDIGTWVYGKLSTNAPLLALIGTTDHVSGAWPHIITVFPYVIYRDAGQRDILFVDNLPQADDSVVVVDVFVKNDSPQAIAQAIANLLKAEYWACVGNEDIPDPDPAIRHRSMRFTRPLFAGDLS